MEYRFYSKTTLQPWRLKVFPLTHAPKINSDRLVGLNTTAGSFSLLRSIVPEDAGVVKNLRKAGAIILGT